MKFIAFLMWLEIVASTLLFSYQPLIAPIKFNHDPRPGQLRAFMDRHHFAHPYYIHEYIQAADKNHLDFAILPGIAVLESEGCVHYVKNNCFGWNSARTGFGSIQEGIAYVSDQLANGRAYRGKTLEQKIHAYNSVNPSYFSNLTKLINEIHE